MLYHNKHRGSCVAIGIEYLRNTSCKQKSNNTHYVFKKDIDS